MSRPMGSSPDYQTGATYDPPAFPGGSPKKESRTGCLVFAFLAFILLVLAGGGAVAFLAYTGGRADYATAPATNAANEFLALIGEGNVGAAYQKTTPSYQAIRDEAAFEREVEELGLTNFVMVEWQSREAKDGEARLMGTVVTGRNDVKLSMDLKQSGDQWLVRSFMGAVVGGGVVDDLEPDQVVLPGDTLAADLLVSETVDEPAGPEASADEVPDEYELARLVTESILELNKAILTRDFDSFHEYVSTMLSDEHTPEELQSRFQEFINKGIDMSRIENYQPEFSEPPSIDSFGLLLAAGRFPAAPDVVFDLKYTIEEGRWRVHTISVEQKPEPGAGEVPDREALDALAHDSIMALDRAIKAADFGPFYEDLSEYWQRQTTPEDIQKEFQVFIDRPDLDVGAIQGLTPELDGEPAIDENRWLTFSGAYPSEPHKVNFVVAYLFENGEWKLVSISVNM